MNESDVRELVAADPRTREIRAILSRGLRRYRRMDVVIGNNDPVTVMLKFCYSTAGGADGETVGVGHGEDATEQAVGEALAHTKLRFGT